MNDLVRYDSMILAIAECHRVDEVKDILDKASALEAYARQADNRDAERNACEIRLRAERKAGDLLQAMKREQGRRTDTSRNAGVKSEYRAAIDDAKIAPRTADRYQALVAEAMEWGPVGCSLPRKRTRLIYKGAFLPPRSTAQARRRNQNDPTGNYLL